MAFYEDLRDNTVIPLLNKFGKPVEIQQKSAGVFDPVSGTYSTSTYEKLDNGIAVQTNYKNSEVDGKTIIQGDKKLIMLTNNNNEIAVNDRIIMESITWNIMSIDEVKPADVRVLYKLQIRKG